MQLDRISIVVFRARYGEIIQRAQIMNRALLLTAHAYPVAILIPWSVENQNAVTKLNQPSEEEKHHA